MLSDASLGGGQPGADPFGHIHGRRFTADKAGVYTVGFKAYDISTNGTAGSPIHTAAEILDIVFQAGYNLTTLTRGLTAFASSRGEAYVLFRTARTMMQRDMALLVSSDHGGSFRESFSHPWSVGMCPMSSANIASADNGTWAAWETAGRVQFARFSNDDWKAQPRAFGALKGAKHPRVAVNRNGETLLLWTEGTGWRRGGSFAWQLLDAKGEPNAEKGQREGIPAWSYATAYARLDGEFVILH
jgi:hypothetical protein